MPSSESSVHSADVLRRKLQWTQIPEYGISRFRNMSEWKLVCDLVTLCIAQQLDDQEALRNTTHDPYDITKQKFNL